MVEFTNLRTDKNWIYILHHTDVDTSDLWHCQLELGIVKEVLLEATHWV